MPSIISIATVALVALSASVSASPRLMIRAACQNNGTPSFSGKTMTITDLDGKPLLADGKNPQLFLVQNDGKFPGSFIIKNAAATANGLTLDPTGTTSTGFSPLVNGNSGTGQSWKIKCEECTVDSKTPASKCTIKPNGKDSSCLTTSTKNNLGLVEACSTDSVAKKAQTFNFVTN
ncbi:hypothetical protein VNI00_000280 [Paramarasmius palmivorus]|uniref:Uncharacterized protein n=1 Tax=Paramarasmius palmivorus TaxID=297713 RepID=A0AAW0EF83_9AGAR